MSEENKPFNVKDRRMFTADGEVRREEPDPPPAAQAPEPQPPPPEAAAPPEEPPLDAPEDERGAPTAVDFPGFLMSLASQGMQALVAQPPRLREARALISILEMLKDKTEGRRTPEENDVLDALLYQLRMGYLERQRTGGA
jgi:hypothetical protein